MNKFEWACSQLAAFAGQGNYGEVIFTFQNGDIVMVKTVKNDKPPVDVS